MMAFCGREVKAVLTTSVLLKGVFQVSFNPLSLNLTLFGEVTKEL